MTLLSQTHLVSLPASIVALTAVNGSYYTYYKITKIVPALWLAERRVCMRVCKHGCVT